MLLAVRRMNSFESWHLINNNIVGYKLSDEAEIIRFV